jgi:hypothetical protein
MDPFFAIHDITVHTGDTLQYRDSGKRNLNQILRIKKEAIEIVVESIEVCQLL